MNLTENLMLFLFRATALLAVFWVVFQCLRSNPRARVLWSRLVCLALGGLPILSFLPSADVFTLPNISSVAPIQHPPELSRPSPLKAEKIEETEFHSQIDLPHRPAPVLPPIQDWTVSESIFAVWFRGTIQFAFALWLVGIFLLLARWLAGLVYAGMEANNASIAPRWVQLTAKRLGREIGLQREVTVRVSAKVCSPVLIGPRLVILLPRPLIAQQKREDIRCALAHELVHVRQLDWHWSQALHVTASLVWPVPLAWYLRSAHDSATECVCDHLAASVLGDSKAYAGSLARQSLFALGHTPLTSLPMLHRSRIRQRVERLLSGSSLPGVTRTMMALALFSMLILMLILGGIHAVQADSLKVSPTPAPTPVPEVSTPPADSKEDKESDELRKQGWKLTAVDAAELEKKVAANPADLNDRIKLLWYYDLRETKEAKLEAAALPHILWIINNAPDSPAAGDTITEPDYVIDHYEYLQARSAWMIVLPKRPHEPKVLGNAGKFFLLFDKDRAEKLFLTAEQLDPSNPDWPENLGQLYQFKATDYEATNVAENFNKSLEQNEKWLALTKTDSDRVAALVATSQAAMDANNLVKADQYANQLLKLIPQNATEADLRANFGDAIYTGHSVLGQVALTRGDLNTAKKELLAAGDTPGSAVLDSFGPSCILAKHLFEKGEKDVVLQFLTKVGLFWKGHEQQLQGWKTTIQTGGTPSFNNFDHVINPSSTEVAGSADTPDPGPQSPIALSEVPLDFKSVHPLRPVGSYENLPAESLYPYDYTFDCSLPDEFDASPGAWIKITSPDGKVAFCMVSDEGFSDGDKSFCPCEDALEYLNNDTDLTKAAKMSWQFVPIEQVAPGPWNPTHDDPKTFTIRYLESHRLNHALEDAVYSNNFQLVKRLWEAQPPGVHYCSEIVYAISQDRPISELDALYAKGAPVKTPDFEISAITVAAVRKNIPALQWLVDHGATLESPGRNRPLELAAGRGDFDVVKFLLEHGVKKYVQLNMVAKSDDTPEHRAMIDLLDKYQLFRPDPRGDPFSIMQVCQAKDSVLLQTLLKDGFNPLAKFDNRNRNKWAGKSGVQEIEDEAKADSSMAPLVAILLKATGGKEEPVDNASSNPLIGKVIDLSFVDVNGSKVDLKQLKGKVVLIDFWATWCGPCVQVMPQVRDLYTKYHDKGLEVIGISLDKDKAKLMAFTKENNLPWPQYFDGAVWNNKFATDYNIRAIPDIWIVGQDGKLIQDNAEGIMEQLVPKLLNH